MRAAFLYYFAHDLISMRRNIFYSILLFIIIVLPLGNTFGQSISRSEYNGFTGEYSIESSIVTLKQGYTTGFGVTLQAVSNALYLTFIGYGKKNTLVNEDERIQFLLKDGTVIKFPARVQLPSNESAVPNLYIHHYYISKKEIELLQASPVLIMRVVSINTQNDIAINKKGAKELMKLSADFLKEMTKY
jgi:hypothetical protein